MARNLKNIKSIKTLEKSRLYLIQKAKETGLDRFFLASCEYAKEIIRRDPNYELKNSINDSM